MSYTKEVKIETFGKARKATYGSNPIEFVTVFAEGGDRVREVFGVTARKDRVYLGTLERLEGTGHHKWLTRGVGGGISYSSDCLFTIQGLVNSYSAGLAMLERYRNSLDRARGELGWA